jgi:hypothetical protein
MDRGHQDVHIWTNDKNNRVIRSSLCGNGKNRVFHPNIKTSMVRYISISNRLQINLSYVFNKELV